MPVIGYSLTSISAEKKSVKSLQKLDINSTPDVKYVEEKDITIVDKEPALVIGFEFTTTYSPDVGHIKINGELVYSSANNKKIVKEWKKNKKLPTDVDIDVKNFLFRRCLTLGIDLSENLQLPPPLVFPVVVPNKENEKTRYIG